MKLNYFTFLRRLVLYTLILAGLGVATVFLLPEDYVSPTIPYLYLFFFSVTILIHYILLQVAIKKAANFVNYFMLLTFGKLIFFLTIVLVYGFFRREDLVQFVVAFFILYVFYTVFEVAQSLSVTKMLKQSKDQDSGLE